MGGIDQAVQEGGGQPGSFLRLTVMWTPASGWDRRLIRRTEIALDDSVRFWLVISQPVCRMNHGNVFSA